MKKTISKEIRKKIKLPDKVDVKLKDKIFDLKKPEFSQMQMRGMRRVRTPRKETGMMARVDRKKAIKDWKKKKVLFEKTKKKEAFHNYGKQKKPLDSSFE